MEGTVKQVKRLFGPRSPCLNLILESKPYPRLYITSTNESEGTEGVYKKDILLYGSLKAVAKSNDLFEITCPYSKKKYIFENYQARDWVKEIMKLIIDIKSHEENSEHLS